MAIGFDVGTYNLVSCRRTADNNFKTEREVNSFFEVSLEDPLAFNAMRSVSVSLIERKDLGVAYAFGEAAVRIAYTMNKDMKRPMEGGCLNPRERNAQQMLSYMIHGMLEGANPQEMVYYSVPSNAINEETDADYHDKVLQAIFRAATDENGQNLQLRANPINEGLALIYAELHDKALTGAGISFGAGMVNVCFAIFGVPVFSFALVNSGDWIDKMSAKATGETPTFINKEKTKVNLLENSSSLVHRTIKAQYEIMISKTINGIKQGLEKVGNKGRTEEPIDVVIAGGTASAMGFDELFAKAFNESKIPLNINRVVRPGEPLYSVAKGCLIAAEFACRQ